MSINIGMTEAQRKTIAEGLSKVLADSYTLYLKTHNYHWNVEGPMFRTLHLMFEEQYTELAEAVDEIAERIRALGFPAPGSYSEFAALTSIKENNGKPDALTMIRELVEGQETVVRTCRVLLPAVPSSRQSMKPTTNRPRISSPPVCKPTKKPRGCCAPYWKNKAPRHDQIQ